MKYEWVKYLDDYHVYTYFGTPLPPSSFLKGGSKLWLAPPEGVESEKLKKGGGTMVQGQVFLK